jgi:hypothetical protein
MSKHLPSVLIIFIAATSSGFAQQDTVAQPVYGWKHSVVAGLTLTQVAYTDWVGGGDNALAYALSSDGKSIDEQERWDWATTYKFGFGQTRLGNQGLRKTEDIIDVSTVYTYKLGTLINPYAAATFKSQFAKGFLYDETGTATEVSKFLDPAFLTQSAGVGYQPTKEVKTRIGLALREIITDQFNQYADDPATAEVERTRVDGGMEWVTNLDWTLDDNMLLLSQLELFSPFKDFSEPVIRSTTGLNMKVNSYITASMNLQLIREPRVSPRSQIKESIALGLRYTLF